MVRKPPAIARLAAAAAASLVVGLVVPNAAEATTYQAGTFVMGIGGTPHVHAYNANMSSSGIAEKGTLKGWRLELSAYENDQDCAPGYCYYDWYGTALYLSHGDDAIWGRCSSSCGRDPATGQIDMQVRVVGLTGQYSGITGSGQLKGDLGGPQITCCVKVNAGELRLTLALNSN